MKWWKWRVLCGNTSGLASVVSSASSSVNNSLTFTSRSFSESSLPSSGRNLHVDNLPRMSEVELKNLFQPFGPVLRTRVAIDSHTGLHAGYGFVLFENDSDALKAVEAMNDSVVQNKALRVTFARQKPKTESSAAPPNTNLYVSGVPSTFTKKDLDELFQPFGNIVESRILMDKSSGESRGIGFVRFDSQSACNRAIRSLHSTQPANVNQPISVRYALDKSTSHSNILRSANNQHTVSNTNSPYLSLNLSSLLPSAHTHHSHRNMNLALFSMPNSPMSLTPQFMFPHSLSMAASALSSPLTSPTAANAAAAAAAAFNSNMFNASMNPYLSNSQLYSHQQQQLIDAASLSNFVSPIVSTNSSQQQQHHEQIQAQIYQLQQASLTAAGDQLSSQHRQNHQSAAQAAQLQAQLAAAVSALNYSMFNTHPPSNTSSTSSLPTTSAAATTLFVSHLHSSITESDLVTLFEGFGPVVSVAVIRDGGTGSSRGFGFVGLSTRAECELAVQYFNGVTLAGKQLKVMFKR